MFGRVQPFAWWSRVVRFRPGADVDRNGMRSHATAPVDVRLMQTAVALHHHFDDNPDRTTALLETSWLSIIVLMATLMGTINQAMPAGCLRAQLVVFSLD